MASYQLFQDFLEFVSHMCFFPRIFFFCCCTFISFTIVWSWKLLRNFPRKGLTWRRVFCFALVSYFVLSHNGVKGEHNIGRWTLPDCCSISWLSVCLPIHMKRPWGESAWACVTHYGSNWSEGSKPFTSNCYCRYSNICNVVPVHCIFVTWAHIK